MVGGWGCPAEQYIYYICSLLSEMASSLYNLAVVAADQLRCVGSSHHHPLAAADKLLGSAGGHGAQGSDARAERLRRPSRAAGWLECAHGTDKAPGEPELSRPMARAAPTPSTGVCAPPMCRPPCTSALTRMLACHMRLCLGRLWDHSKQSSMSLLHPFPCCDTYRTRARTVG